MSLATLTSNTQNNSFEIPEEYLKLIDLRLQQFKKEYGINTFPIDCVKLIKDIQKSKNLNIHVRFVDDIPCECIGDSKNSVDALTVYSPSNNTYYMAINKSRHHVHYPFTTSASRRLNFTLAHELAHIVMNHLDIPDECKDDYTRKLEEAIADEFAGRFLMPDEYILSCNFTHLAKVAEKFNVSEHAILKKLTVLNCHHIRKNNKKIVCEVCENRVISPTDQFCHICGTYLEGKKRGIKTLKYIDGYELDSNNRCSICPKCSNEHFPSDAFHCPICGQALFNNCTNSFCNKLHLSGNDRYCPECGSNSTFYNQGLLLEWSKAQKTMINQMDFEAEQAPNKKQRKLLPNWDDIKYAIRMDEDYDPRLSLVLDNSVAKICEDTLIIYVSSELAKDYLEHHSTFQEYLFQLVKNYLPNEISASLMVLITAIFDEFTPNTISVFEDELPF